jgi:hypothetical protein
LTQLLALFSNYILTRSCVQPYPPPPRYRPRVPCKGFPVRWQVSNDRQPLTLDATNVAPETSKPPGPSGAQCSPIPAPTLDPIIGTTLGLGATDIPHHPEPVESPRMTLPSPQPQGPSSSGEASIGGESVEIPQEILRQCPPPRVADTLA